MNPITPPARRRPKHLPLLQRLFAIRAADLSGVLCEASTLVAELFDSEKVECYLVDEAAASLVALGVSQTALGSRQVELGLDRLPLTRGGRVAEVFLHQRSHLTGHADRDPLELPAFARDLGIRSIMAVPLFVETTCRGVLVADSLREEWYARDDLALLDTIGHWIGLLLQRDDTHQRAGRAGSRGWRPNAAGAAPAPAPEETTAQLTQECLRLRSEMLYWKGIADELLMELHRRELRDSSGT